jgi:malonate transporter and related proteins
LFANLFSITAPLFLLVLLGYLLTAWGKWPKAASVALTRFVFSVALPTLLFRLMSDFSHLPHTDPRLLIAYFGSCLFVFVLGRAVGRFLFRMDGASQSVFAMGGIFSNNVMLGVPLAKLALGDAAMPAVSLVLVFNTLLLWMLVTVSVEWARNRSTSVRDLARTAKGVITTPVVLGVLSGAAFGTTGLQLPSILDQTMATVSQAAIPLSLSALGMGLQEYGIGTEWRESAAVCVLKLVAQALAVVLLAWTLQLPAMETRVVVLLACLPVGANVYLMARQFNVLGGAVASSLVASTALAAGTTPLALALVGAG